MPQTKQRMNEIETRQTGDIGANRATGGRVASRTVSDALNRGRVAAATRTGTIAVLSELLNE